MKHVLMFAYYYPPMNSSASQRTGCMAKYLPEFGWKPLVVSGRWTPENCAYDAGCVRGFSSEALLEAVEGPGHDFDGSDGLFGFLARRHYQLMIRPRVHPASWTRNVLRVLPDLVRDRRIDAAWATYRPDADFYLASHCERRWGLPWVADFRDVPGQFGTPKGLRHRLLLRRMIGAHKRTVKNATALTAISEGLADILRGRHGKDVHVIPNGFDPDNMAEGEGHGSDTFTLTYTGCMYPTRSPEPILEAIARLIDRDEMAEEDVRVHFYTDYDPAAGHGDKYFLPQLLKAYRYPRIAEAHAFLAKDACDRVCRASTVLLMPGEPGRGILTSKLFEYMAAQRPVLAGPGCSEELTRVLEETGAGVFCPTVEETAARLLRWYREWKQGGTVAYGGRREALLKYSRRDQAGQLADVLDRMAGG